MLHEDARERGTECLTEDLVLRFVSRQAPPAAVEAIEAHLADCDDCRGLVAELVRGDEGDEPTPATSAPGAGGNGARLPRAGDAVGRYRVSHTIGMGGMGVVFLATDPTLNRRVTLKLLRAERQAHRTAPRELLHEAQSMAKLAHPNVVSVYDAGTFDDQVFIAMEFVERATFRPWLADGPQPRRRALAVSLGAGRGLAAAHAEGIIHRDFKPSNVLVGKDGRAKVTDFGLARAVAMEGDEGADGEAAIDDPLLAGSPATLSPTRTGTVKGTPGYMAPEQFAGRRVDGRADQFSFCVALHEGLYGRRPFETERTTGREEALRPSAPPAFAIDDPIPEALRDCVLRGLAVEPSARHESMTDLLAALEAASARRARPTWRRARPWIAAGLVAATGVAAAAVTRARSLTSEAGGAVSASALATTDAPALVGAAASSAPLEDAHGSPSAATGRPTAAPLSIVSTSPRATPRRGTRRTEPSHPTPPKTRYDDAVMEPSFVRKK